MKMMQITSELLSASYIDVELSIVSQIAFNMKLWDLKQRYEPMGGVFESQYKIHIREYRVTTMAPDYRGVKGMEVSGHMSGEEIARALVESSTYSLDTPKLELKKNRKSRRKEKYG